ncbi:MAG: inorganic phosphate transporter [Planctomycetes bacterium]|nr:inorganic phosphate transporter [Planctomycetota bacterium]
MAWNIGANDVANAMGTSVGSGALTLRRAVILAAILEFAGAFLVGSHVSETVRKGIVDPAVFSDVQVFIYGMLASLLAAGVWLQIASYFGWPVSTTHSIVGAIIGFGAVYGGMDAVHWGKVGGIVSSWVISPVLSATISYLLFRLVLRQIFYRADPVRAAKRLTPIIVFVVFFTLTLVLFFKGLKNLKLDFGPITLTGIAIAVGGVAAGVARALTAKIRLDPKVEEPAADEAVIASLDRAARHLIRARTAARGEIREQANQALKDVVSMAGGARRQYRHGTSSQRYQQVEHIFVYLQIVSACLVAFAHGANDVANSIGPLSAVVQTVRSGAIAVKSDVPLWALALGGVGIVAGLATWGWRVMETVGKRITELTPTRGFCAEFGAAITILVASKAGWPISTTHTLVGAVLGVGLARGMGALNLNTVRDIVISWIVTVPAGATLAVVLFWVLRSVFGS